MRNFIISLFLGLVFGISNATLINFIVEKDIGKSIVTMAGRRCSKTEYFQIKSFSRIAMPVSLFISRDRSIDKRYKYVGFLNGAILALIYFFLNFLMLRLVDKKFGLGIILGVSIGVFIILYSVSFAFWISGNFLYM